MDLGFQERKKQMNFFFTLDFNVQWRTKWKKKLIFFFSHVGSLAEDLGGKREDIFSIKKHISQNYINAQIFLGVALLTWNEKSLFPILSIFLYQYIKIHFFSKYPTLLVRLWKCCGIVPIRIQIKTFQIPRKCVSNSKKVWDQCHL